MKLNILMNWDMSLKRMRLDGKFSKEEKMEWRRREKLSVYFSSAFRVSFDAARDSNHILRCSKEANAILFDLTKPFWRWRRGTDCKQRANFQQEQKRLPNFFLRRGQFLRAKPAVTILEHQEKAQKTIGVLKKHVARGARRVHEGENQPNVLRRKEKEKKERR